MRAALAAILLTILGVADAAAQTIPCGEPYTIRRGDTLRRIAARAYGPEADFAPIWEANRARLGWANPSLIDLGQVIDVPCLDAAGAPLAPAAAARDADGAAPAGASAVAAPAVEPPPGRDATADASAPADAGATDAAPPDAAGATSAGAAAADAASPVADAEPQGATATTAASAARVATPTGAGDATGAGAAPGPTEAATAAGRAGTPAAAGGPDAPARSGGVDAPAGEPPAVAAEIATVALPPTPPDAAPATDASPTPAATAAVAPVDLLLTPAPPFVDPSQAGGGFAARLLARALEAGGRTVATRAAAGAEAPETGFELSFPQVRPDCAAVPAPPVCARLLWSEPVAELVVAFVTGAGVAVGAGDAALDGLRVCAASGTPEAALRARGARPGATARAASAEACLADVAAGRTDVAALETSALEGARLPPGLVERRALTAMLPLRAAAPADAPGAAALIATLDAGLAALRDSGALFEATRAGLDAR
jgi:hypothetical protein